MNKNTVPAAAIAAMDQAAKAFWAYPNAEWQDAFLEQWMQTHETLGDRAPEALIVCRHTTGYWCVFDSDEGEEVSRHWTEDEAYAARWNMLTPEQQEDAELTYEDDTGGY